jgi:dinuclear metal center YbgI/SA1388 family protein
MPTVAEVVHLLEQRYPPVLASDWDAVGLVVGDPAASVRSVLFAVDPVPAVIDQALMERVDMVVTHHPLFLDGVHSVASDTAKGRMVHDLIGHGIALYAAHTNADHARPGVSDALADLLGVQDTRPIDPLGTNGLGTGRIGTLAAPTTVGSFAESIRTLLPPTSIRVAGNLDAPVLTVAVCGGSGGSLLPHVTGADVFVTADIRHHRAQDHLVESGCALIDVSHWASEWPWLPAAAAALEQDAATQGDTVKTMVSDICTDPWTKEWSR